jgi:hypothetical protein
MEVSCRFARKVHALPPPGAYMMICGLKMLA